MIRTSAPRTDSLIAPPVGARPTIGRVPKDAASRRQRALAAARDVALRTGLEGADAHVLRDAHNTLVLLPAAGVVAKVGTSSLDERGVEALERELAIGHHLALRGAPIAPPMSGGAAGPHRSDRLVVTLWGFRATVAAPKEHAAALARALGALHEALADLPIPLPSVADTLERAASLIADRRTTPGLNAADRELLARIHDATHSRVPGKEAARNLHGEPHPGNVLWTSEGPLFVDFEAACAGPLEWDLAFLPGGAARFFTQRNNDLLAAMRHAVSFCVAAWCSAQQGRSGEVDAAAELHLAVLRSAYRGH